MQLCSLGQCPHAALFHAVPGCCRCFQQCRVAGTAKVGTLGSYQTLLETLATPWDSVKQCCMGALSLVPRSKVASSGPTFMELSQPLLHEDPESSANETSCLEKPKTMHFMSVCNSVLLTEKKNKSFQNILKEWITVCY